MKNSFFTTVFLSNFASTALNISAQNIHINSFASEDWVKTEDLKSLSEEEREDRYSPTPMITADGIHDLLKVGGLFLFENFSDMKDFVNGLTDRHAGEFGSYVAKVMLGVEEDVSKSPVETPEGYPPMEFFLREKLPRIELDYEPDDGVFYIPVQVDMTPRP